MPAEKLAMLDPPETDSVPAEETAESALPGAQDAENRKAVTRGVTTAARLSALTRFQRPLLPQN